MEHKAYRLPRQIWPRHYTIALDARMGVAAFHGRVTIELDIQETRRTIELHAHDLDISQARLTARARTLTGEVSLDASRELATLDFGEPLAVGAATLELEFQGMIGQALRGLYLSQDGGDAVLSTQCEATYARYIFPCFDEPEFKARFAWQVTTAVGDTVLANGPLLEVTQGNDSTATWTFQATKPMSSYLVALVIGKMASTETEIVQGVPLRVWALAGQEALGTFAQAYTVRLLPWYEDYFGASYHFDKYDQAAVPGFEAGAMENSGLVIFNRRALLMAPGTTSWRQEKSIAHVVAHEFAHMWFGNLVTLRWWDDLWLNEAFAEWISYTAVDMLTPDYAIWDDFQQSKLGMMQTDALPSTHAIYRPVATADEAVEMFDNITYTKGCAVLTMLEHYLGPEVFREGLRTYMQAFGESNATGSDLWRHLREASSEPVDQLMQGWITQSGYPVVHISAKVAGEVATLTLRQERFYSEPSDVGTDGGTLWPIPLVIRYEDTLGVHETRHLMEGQTSTVSLPVRGDLMWCYANSGEAGVYRQNLEGALLRGVLAHIEQLTPREQVGFLGDQWALARNGSQTMAGFLNVLATAASSAHRQVLEAVTAHLHTLEDMIEQDDDQVTLERMRAWVAKTFAAKQADLGFAPRAGESRNDSQARLQVFDAMASLAHDTEAIAQAEQIAAREAVDPGTVDADIAPIGVRVSAQFGDRARFERYVEIYQQRKASGSAPQLADRYLRNLPLFQQPESVSRVLQLVEEGIVPLESVGITLSQMLYLHHTQRAAWEYLKTHWASVEQLDTQLTRLVAATGHLPETLREDVITFFTAHLHGRAQQSYTQALTYMERWATFRRRTRDDVAAWFAANA